MVAKRQRVVYVTSSAFKVEENRVFSEVCRLSDGAAVKDLFHFEHRSVDIKEILEVDLRVMVAEEVVTAYSQIRVPCIVEHAGLVFTDYESAGYPGGLTKPMWDTLRDDFVTETRSAERAAIARAVVGYCDGMSVHTFVGETSGKLASSPRGERRFYWDTVFIPDTNDSKAIGKTYAEIVGAADLGLAYKMRSLSQSSKAMLKFLEYVRKNSGNALWAQAV